MRLMYLVSPRNLIKESSYKQMKKVLLPNNPLQLNSYEDILKDEIGHCASVVIESSPTINELPRTSLYSITNDGKLEAVELGPNNTIKLFVRYALRFDKPIPLSIANLGQISELT